MMAAPFASIVLDNEAVYALFDVKHPKHGAVLPYVDGVARRKQRNASVRVYVPVAVRVEVGWDRTAVVAATINLVAGAADVVLDAAGANRAAQFVSATGVSVVDATVAATAASVPHPVAILTSDVGDMTVLAGSIGGDVRVVHI